MEVAITLSYVSQEIVLDQGTEAVTLDRDHKRQTVKDHDNRNNTTTVLMADAEMAITIIGGGTTTDKTVNNDMVLPGITREILYRTNNNRNKFHIANNNKITPALLPENILR